jgi:hypothetical protein
MVFYGKNSRILPLKQMKSGTVKDHGHTYRFYLFDETIKYGDGAKFGGYIGTEAEPLCAEFCIFCSVMP